MSETGAAALRAQKSGPLRANACHVWRRAGGSETRAPPPPLRAAQMSGISARLSALASGRPAAAAFGGPGAGAAEVECSLARRERRWAAAPTICTTALSTHGWARARASLTPWAAVNDRVRMCLLKSLWSFVAMLGLICSRPCLGAAAHSHPLTGAGSMATPPTAPGSAVALLLGSDLGGCTRDLLHRSCALTDPDIYITTPSKRNHFRQVFPYRH